MPSPKTTVKSTARSDRAKALMAALPRDPVTGRIQKRAGAASPPAAPIVPDAPPPPAGGPASTPPFVQAPRGLRAFKRPRSA